MPNLRAFTIDLGVKVKVKFFILAFDQVARSTGISFKGF